MNEPQGIHRVMKVVTEELMKAIAADDGQMQDEILNWCHTLEVTKAPVGGNVYLVRGYPLP